MSLAAELRNAVRDEQSESSYRFNDAVAFVILISVVGIILESVDSIMARWGAAFFWAEVFFTAFFAVEYAIRLYFAPNRWAYARSPFGIIDLLAFLPSIFIFAFPAFTEVHSLRILRVIRVLRLLRLFRILKLTAYLRRRRRGETTAFVRGLSAVNMEIYFFTLFSVVVIAGTLMYLAEAGVPGSKIINIPGGMWWAIVTITTVGYGDFVPVSVTGKIIAALTMIAGLSLFALVVAVMGRALEVALFGSPLEEERSAATNEADGGETRGDGSARAV